MQEHYSGVLLVQHQHRAVKNTNNGVNGVKKLLLAAEDGFMCQL
jgi:hypothetical protein